MKELRYGTKLEQFDSEQGEQDPLLSFILIAREAREGSEDSSGGDFGSEGSNWNRLLRRWRKNLCDIDHEFIPLMQTCVGACRTVARRIVRDHDEVEEVVQSALVRAYIDLRNSRDEKEQWTLEQRRAWLLKIVHHEALRSIAKSKRFSSSGASEEGRFLLQEASEYDNPEMVLMQAEDKKALDELLDLLSPAYHDIIVLRVLAGWSYEKIAETTQCDIRTLRTKFHRAAHSLAKIVEKRQIHERDLQRWLFLYQFDVQGRALPLRDYLKGTAYDEFLFIPGLSSNINDLGWEKY